MRSMMCPVQWEQWQTAACHALRQAVAQRRNQAIDLQAQCRVTLACTPDGVAVRTVVVVQSEVRWLDKTLEQGPAATGWAPRAPTRDIGLTVAAAIDDMVRSWNAALALDAPGPATQTWAEAVLGYQFGGTLPFGVVVREVIARVDADGIRSHASCSGELALGLDFGGGSGAFALSCGRAFFGRFSCGVAAGAAVRRTWACRPAAGACGPAGPEPDIDFAFVRVPLGIRALARKTMLLELAPTWNFGLATKPGAASRWVSWPALGLTVASAISR